MMEAHSRLQGCPGQPKPFSVGGGAVGLEMEWRGARSRKLSTLHTADHSGGGGSYRTSLTSPGLVLKARDAGPGGEGLAL